MGKEQSGQGQKKKEREQSTWNKQLRIFHLPLFHMTAAIFNFLIRNQLLSRIKREESLVYLENLFVVNDFNWKY